MANVLVRTSVLSVSRLLLLPSPKPPSCLSNGSSALRGFHNITTNALSNGGLGLGLAGGAPMLRFCIRAAHVNDAGSIDSPLMQSMQNKIKEHLKAESVVVKDAYGDGRHVSIDVIASSFEGQSAVNRQRMVYKAIWEELQSTVHAVDQMTTRTPAEAASD
ncbi:protein BOLA4, chloroplastic/mitochondrial [Rhodamnia argentea]|uniref:Protein BOLA4, chloroplastic/mitochondrial n=1 Tax=Rhodamnia argentea TaxID=178133 RepID=A0A8B8PE72_9MYRT|nr:protein BOLA4, chloroplastic/mitochondrial [Rhodamnia argentea]